MHSFLLHVLSCCLRTKQEDENEEDRSLLANAENLGAPPLVNYGSTHLDNQKAKERLGDILRSKRDKMVDVKHDAPFNLRNSPRSKRERDSSYSHRSSSINGTDDARAYPGLRHTSDSMLPTPARSRVASPSPKPSPDISRSQSATSLSRHSLGDDSPEIYREPVLNARLVSLRGARKKANRRGRSRAKFGLEQHPQRNGVLAPSNGDATPEGVTTFMGDATDANMDADTSGAEDSFADGDGDVSLNVEVPTSPLSGRPLMSPLNDEEQEEVKSVSNEITRALREGFKIIDVGSISRGWGE